MGTSNKLYHLQGFLKGISTINSSTDLVCSFKVIELGKIVELEDMIKKHLEASSVDISEIIEWKNTLNGTLKKWFFYLHDQGEFKPHNDGWCGALVKTLL